MNYKNQLKRLEAKAKKYEAANDYVGLLKTRQEIDALVCQTFAPERPLKMGDYIPKEDSADMARKMMEALVAADFAYGAICEIDELTKPYNIRINIGPLMKDIRKKLGELTGIVYDRGGLAFFEHYDAMIDEVKAKCWYHVQNVISGVVSQRSREYDEQIEKDNATH